jgi:hypothetical protein
MRRLGHNNLLHVLPRPVHIRYGFRKERARNCYAEVLFLHLVGSAGHLVHSSASGV